MSLISYDEVFGLVFFLPFLLFFFCFFIGMGFSLISEGLFIPLQNFFF